MNTARLHDPLKFLLNKIGINCSFLLTPLHGGANNQVFRVDVQGAPICLKVYFKHPDDLRDRLSAEFSFTSFAWDKGIRSVPKPLISDRKNGIALYEFISGRSLHPGEVTRDSVRQALSFYNELNRDKHDQRAEELPKASESCFSIDEHVRVVNNRIERLKAIKDSSTIDREAIKFASGDLSDFWIEIIESVQRKVDLFKLNPGEPIPKSDWRLSPSDFGFHNCILGVDGKLRFIDFEYAGWDDPDRMVCDFFCQQSVPAPGDCYRLFAEGVAAGLVEQEMHRKRMDLLLPVYQVKWCCILLNDFLPVGKRRRHFAGSIDNHEEQKIMQLRKAHHALIRFKEEQIIN